MPFFAPGPTVNAPEASEVTAFIDTDRQLGADDMKVERTAQGRVRRIAKTLIGERSPRPGSSWRRSHASWKCVRRPASEVSPRRNRISSESGVELKSPHSR